MDEISPARELQLIFFNGDGGHRLFAGEDFQVGHGEQQFRRRRQRTKAIAQFLLQAFERGLLIRLRKLAINFNPMLRFGDVVVRERGVRREM